MIKETMKIVHTRFGVPQWDEGGFAPFQAYLKVEYGNFPYTIYVRERHDHWSCDIFYGWHSLTHNSNVYELTSPNKESLFESENDFLNYEERAVVLAEKFFEKNRHRLPRRREY